MSRTFPRVGNEQFGIVDNVVGQIRTMNLADGTVDDLTVNNLSLGEQMSKGIIKKITGYLPKNGLAKRGFLNTPQNVAGTYNIPTLGDVVASVPTFSYMNVAPDLPESTPTSFDQVLKIPKGNQIISVKVTNNGRKIPVNPLLAAAHQQLLVAGVDLDGNGTAVAYPPVEAAVIAAEPTDQTTGAFLLGLSAAPPSSALPLGVAYGLIDPQGGIVGTLLGLQAELVPPGTPANQLVNTLLTFPGNKADLNQVNGVELFRSCPNQNAPNLLLNSASCLFGFSGKTVSAPGKRWSTLQQARNFTLVGTAGLSFGAAPKYLNEGDPLNDFAYITFHNGTGGGVLQPVADLLNAQAVVPGDQEIQAAMNTTSAEGDVAVEITYYDTSATPEIPV